MHYNKITLSGFAGTGKSTVGKLLAERLNFNFVSVGNFSREFAAKEFGLSINEFQEKCRADPSLDAMIDKRFKEFCNSQSGIIADYRLGFKFITNALHCLLTVSEATAAERMRQSRRQGEAVDHISIKQRNEEMRARFIEKYGVDFSSPDNYQIVINSDNHTPQEIADIIIKSYHHSLL